MIQQQGVAPVVADSLRAVAQSDYIALLERTNQQLSLTWHPLGIMIMAMALLFIVGAVVVAYVLFRQNQEHRQQLEQAVERYERVHARFVQQAAEEELRGKLHDIKTQHERELELARETSRGLLEEAIRKLEEQRAAIDALGDVPQSPGGIRAVEEAREQAAAAQASAQRFARERGSDKTYVECENGHIFPTYLAECPVCDSKKSKMVLVS